MKSSVALCVLSVLQLGLGFDEFVRTVWKQHNIRRKTHLDTPPMYLSNDLTQRAMICAEYYMNGGVLNTCPASEGAGENVWVGDAIIHNETYIASVAVLAQWYPEIKNYDYSNPGYVEAAKHFTQLIWVSTRDIGAAYKRNPSTGKYYVVALYYEPGNVPGMFRANVKPATSVF